MMLLLLMSSAATRCTWDLYVTAEGVRARCPRYEYLLLVVPTTSSTSTLVTQVWQVRKGL